MHVIGHQLVKRPAHARTLRASSTSPMPPTTKARGTAFVYAGEGAGSRSVLAAVEALQLATTLRVETISAESTMHGHWTDAVLLVMPGGADLPYCRRLNGPGNSVIQGTRRVPAH